MTQSILSIVIVNYNSGDQLPRCLDSLRAQTLQDFEVFVLDNNSSDDSMESLAKYGEVQKVFNDSNRGFAAGQNQGFALACGRYVMALNYDLVMTPTFLERLVSGLDAHPQAGFACGKLLNMQPDGTPLNTIYAAGEQLPPDCFPQLRGNGEIDSGQYDKSEFVEGAPGAAAVYRREMIEAISFDGQFFDEQFFTWYEDVDIDWRARRFGFRCLYVPEAVAYHAGHIGEEYVEPYRSWRARLGIRNRWLMIAANSSRAELRENMLPLIRYELASLQFVVRVGMLGAYFGALRDVAALLPYVRNKRIWIQSARSWA